MSADIYYSKGPAENGFSEEQSRNEGFGISNFGLRSVWGGSSSDFWGGSKCLCGKVKLVKKTKFEERE